MITVCTPTRDVVQATFTFDLVNLLKHSNLMTTQAEFLVGLGSYIPNNRIILVRQSLEMDASHILFIDSDMRFPKDALEQLLQTDKDIVGANCKQRTQDEWTARRGDYFVASDKKTGLEEIDILGFGVTLIKREVFEKLPEPWFAMPYHSQDKKLIGEDVYFCTIAKEQGLKIWIDHDLSQEVKHTGSREF